MCPNLSSCSCGGGPLALTAKVHMDVYLYWLELYWYAFAQTSNSYQCTGINLLKTYVYWYEFDQMFTNKAPTIQYKSP